MAFLSICLTAVLARTASGSLLAHYWLPADDAQPIIVSELGFGNPESPNVTENTLEAFKEGLARGASGVEVTSRLTADGKIAMLHDDEVPGCYGGSRSCFVLKTNFADLPTGTLSLDQVSGDAETPSSWLSSNSVSLAPVP